MTAIKKARTTLAACQLRFQQRGGDACFASGHLRRCLPAFAAIDLAFYIVSKAGGDALGGLARPRFAGGRLREMLDRPGLDFGEGHAVNHVELLVEFQTIDGKLGQAQTERGKNNPRPQGGRNMKQRKPNHRAEKRVEETSKPALVTEKLRHECGVETGRADGAAGP